MTGTHPGSSTPKKRDIQTDVGTVDFISLWIEQSRDPKVESDSEDWDMHPRTPGDKFTVHSSVALLKQLITFTVPLSLIISRLAAYAKSGVMDFAEIFSLLMLDSLAFTRLLITLLASSFLSTVIPQCTECEFLSFLSQHKQQVTLDILQDELALWIRCRELAQRAHTQVINHLTHITPASPGVRICSCQYAFDGGDTVLVSRLESCIQKVLLPYYFGDVNLSFPAFGTSEPACGNLEDVEVAFLSLLKLSSCTVNGSLKCLNDIRSIGQQLHSLATEISHLIELCDDLRMTHAAVVARNQSFANPLLHQQVQMCVADKENKIYLHCGSQCSQLPTVRVLDGEYDITKSLRVSYELTPHKYMFLCRPLSGAKMTTMQALFTEYGLPGRRMPLN